MEAIRKSRGMLKVAGMIVCSVLLACTLTGCGVVSSLTSTPTKTVENFVEAINNQDFEGALSCCDSSTNDFVDGASSLAGGLMEAAGVSGDWDARELMGAIFGNINEISEATSGEGWSCTVTLGDMQESISNDTHATVVAAYEMVNDSYGAQKHADGSATFNLVKEDGEWKINLSDDIMSVLMG